MYINFHHRHEPLIMVSECRCNASVSSATKPGAIPGVGTWDGHVISKSDKSVYIVLFVFLPHDMRTHTRTSMPTTISCISCFNMFRNRCKGKFSFVSPSSSSTQHTNLTTYPPLPVPVFLGVRASHFFPDLNFLPFKWVDEWIRITSLPFFTEILLATSLIVVSARGKSPAKVGMLFLRSSKAHKTWFLVSRSFLFIVFLNSDSTP